MVVLAIGKEANWFSKTSFRLLREEQVHLNMDYIYRFNLKLRFGQSKYNLRTPSREAEESDVDDFHKNHLAIVIQVQEFGLFLDLSKQKGWILG